MLRNTVKKKIRARFVLVLNVGQSPGNSEFNEIISRYPLTSARRAMTNLTEAGYLTKTELKTPGIFGAMNFNWRLNADYKMEQRGLFA